MTILAADPLAPLGLQSVSFVTIGPPLIIAITAIVVLITDLFLPAGEAGRALRNRMTISLSLGGVVAAIVWAALLASDGPRSTFCNHGDICFYVSDGFTSYLQITVLAAIAGVLLLARSSLRDDDLPAGEFGFLLLTSVVGMLVLPASRDLITLVLALEVVSLPAFVLVGLKRNDAKSGESALTYFVFSVISTALMIYGLALMYGITGGLTFAQVTNGLFKLQQQPGNHLLPLAASATVLILVGFTFKIAAVPFHAWVPDTYEGAPLPVAAALGTASKVAGFAGLIVLLFLALSPEAAVWGGVIAALAVASMTVGNLVALRQTNAVRLLAWSTVAQAGYLLVPLATLAEASQRSQSGYRDASKATLFYLAVYAVMNLGAFATLAAVTRWAPRHEISDLRGLARRSPLLAALVAIFFTALAGLPPGVAGLIAKVVILQSAVGGHLTWLAVIAAVNSVIGLAYYLRVAAQPFLGLDEPGVEEESEPIEVAAARKIPAGVTATLALTGVAVVVLSIDPQPLLHAASLALP